MWTIAFLAILALAPQFTIQWSYPSHVIIYMIARLEQSQQKLQQLDNIISYLPESELNYKNPYEYACWADDIKIKQGYKLLDGWHFYDQPICDGIDCKRYWQLLDKKFCVVNTVVDNMRTLKKSSNFPFHFDGKAEKSLALRFLVHFVGDMHQPLHLSTRCTQKLPKCDAGGNLFYIHGCHSTKNLHALWDQAMCKIEFKDRPFTENTINFYMNIAKEIMKEYPRSALQEDLNDKDPWSWANKIYNLSVNYAYSGIKENTTPSNEYYQKGWEVSKRLIALAGYRLSDALKEVVGEENEESVILE